jgi:opacity protein-like surface antigen
MDQWAQVGVGAEFAVMNNWRLGAEVDYTWYDRFSVTGIDPNNTTGSRVTMSVKPTQLSGQVRLSYGF